MLCTKIKKSADIFRPLIGAECPRLVGQQSKDMIINIQSKNYTYCNNEYISITHKYIMFIIL